MRGRGRDGLTPTGRRAAGSCARARARRRATLSRTKKTAMPNSPRTRPRKNGRALRVDAHAAVAQDQGLEDPGEQAREPELDRAPRARQRVAQRVQRPPEEGRPHDGQEHRHHHADAEERRHLPGRAPCDGGFGLEERRRSRSRSCCGLPCSIQSSMRVRAQVVRQVDVQRRRRRPGRCTTPRARTPAKARRRTRGAVGDAARASSKPVSSRPRWSRRNRLSKNASSGQVGGAERVDRARPSGTGQWAGTSSRSSASPLRRSSGP